MEKIEFSTYWKDKHTSDIIISADRRKVEYYRYSDIPIETPFGFDEPTIEQVNDFLKSRCVPERRSQLPDYLDFLGLSEFNPYEIIRKTHGVMFEDFLWIKFPDEELLWENVKIRD